MKLSELRRIDFKALSEHLGTKWYGKPCVHFGALSSFSGSPVALSSESMEKIVLDLMERWGDVQVTVVNSRYGSHKVEPNSPRYKEEIYYKSNEQFEYLNKTFGTNV